MFFFPRDKSNPWHLGFENCHGLKVVSQVYNFFGNGHGFEKKCHGFLFRKLSGVGQIMSRVNFYEIFDPRDPCRQFSVYMNNLCFLLTNGLGENKVVSWTVVGPRRLCAQFYLRNWSFFFAKSPSKSGKKIYSQKHNQGVIKNNPNEFQKVRMYRYRG